MRPLSDSLPGNPPCLCKCRSLSRKPGLLPAQRRISRPPRGITAGKKSVLGFACFALSLVFDAFSDHLIVLGPPPAT